MTDEHLVGAEVSAVWASSPLAASTAALARRPLNDSELLDKQPCIEDMLDLAWTHGDESRDGSPHLYLAPA